MRRNGDPTDLMLEELMINQDEITFIGQRSAGATGAGVVEGYGTAVARETRRYVFFTPGHTISADVQVFGESDLASFAEASDPRFVPLTRARARVTRRPPGHQPLRAPAPQPDAADRSCGGLPSGELRRLSDSARSSWPRWTGSLKPELWSWAWRLSPPRAGRAAKHRRLAWHWS